MSGASSIAKWLTSTLDGAEDLNGLVVPTFALAPRLKRPIGSYTAQMPLQRARTTGSMPTLGCRLAPMTLISLLGLPLEKS